MVVWLSSCTNDEKAYDILVNEGYTDIEMTGYDLFGCSDQDTYSSGFKATNAHGNKVTGVVCGAFIKGYTIRLH